MIGVINYGAGNLGSVMNALGRLSAPACFVPGPEEIALSISGKKKFEKIIFPGDGHFSAAMASLEKSGYAQAIKEWIKADKPFLGICIGLQLLFETSQEAEGEKGLCVLQGNVRRFPGRKIPQIGWNQTESNKNSKIFRGIENNSFFYYIHSYYADPADKDVVSAQTDYYVRYCSAVETGALAAVQFHPEKSGAAGLALLDNWLKI
ncbi:MAG: imidazole glycerol phosphate synthase subunit HisH [Treponema sp.]|nr:imidazole glycerol phosphate synthase subunit HisH [Treponema sp.]